MMTRNYLVKLSAGHSDSSRVWNSRKPLTVGHPIRWVMEQEENGIRIKGENGEHFLKHSDIEKSASVLLGLTPKSTTGLKLELRPVGSVAAASIGEEKSGNALRVFYCKNTWTVDSHVLSKSYSGVIEGKKVFTLSGNAAGTYAKHDFITITAHVSGLTLDGTSPETLKKGESRRLPFYEISGKSLRLADSTWRLAPFQKDSAPNPFSVPGQADSESLLFKKTLKVAGIAMVLAGLISWFIPSAPVVAKKDEKVRILLTAKKKKVHGLMTAAPTGDPRARDTSIGKKGSPKNAGKKGTRVAEKKKVAPAGKKVARAARPSLKPKAVAKVSHQPKPAARAAVAARPVPVQHSELFKALSSSSFRKTARNLVAGSVGGIGKGAASSASEARSLGKSGGSGRGALGAAGGVSTGSVSVAGFGGGGLGDGDGGPGSAGAGYGRGSHSKVSGQGKSFVSMDTGASDVEEGLTRDQVGRVIHSHFNEIRYCHEAASLRSPDVSGTLMMKFSINAPGNVVTAGVGNSTVGDRRFHDCIISRLKGWKFPKPKGGVNVAVAYPIMVKNLTR